MSLNITPENIVALILAARTLTNEEKEKFLDLFSNPKISTEELTAQLKQLMDAEIKLRQEENKNLQNIAVENAQIQAEEEAKIQPEIEQIYTEMSQGEQALIQDYKGKSHQLDRELDKVLETIKRGEKEADTLSAIRAKLGLKK